MGAGGDGRAAAGEGRAPVPPWGQGGDTGWERGDRNGTGAMGHGDGAGLALRVRVARGQVCVCVTWGQGWPGTVYGCATWGQGWPGTSHVWDMGTSVSV